MPAAQSATTSGQGEGGSELSDDRASRARPPSGGEASSLSTAGAVTIAGARLRGKAEAREGREHDRSRLVLVPVRAASLAPPPASIWDRQDSES